MNQKVPPRDTDEYIAGFPESVQKILRRIRKTIRKAAPDAEEKIGYRIPGFRLHGRDLIYFAAFRNHAGMYPAPIDSDEFREELAPYAGGKATVRFPYDTPLPVDLISRIVKHRAAENEKLAAGKKKVRKRI
jgi:uncharacterized protein YdhG (YjbR/CyaY superfamily)